MTRLTLPASPRAMLVDLYWAAVTAVAPGPALRAALATQTEKIRPRVHLLALGKAAYPMAVAAVAALGEEGREPAGGIVVSTEASEAPHPNLRVVAGDHPEPGPGSLAAAKALEYAASRVRPEDECWVLLSGGTTSLIGAPLDGIPSSELSLLYALLLGSGLDITAMNRVRKRFSRWGAGRLAAALAPARVKNFTISDVIGDDLASIGSGPCVPDEATAAEVRSLLTSAGLWEKIPDTLRRMVATVERGEATETPKPGDPAFSNVETRLIASNRIALDTIIRRAEAIGLNAQLISATLSGEARVAGLEVAKVLLNYSNRSDSQSSNVHNNAGCLIWGGETTVTLGPHSGGKGGRNQELGLAAAELLASPQAGGAGAISLLAAGTDGRDGPTDAAGAIVDPGTWGAIRRAGRDPGRDLVTHNAYPALDAADAIFRTGATGTNVMDLVIGIAPAPTRGA